ncbi:MFS transporter, BCD family, chlorophyll transporter [Limimaricola pyoseonensis]|uniref:MFS transporter, BCD family, chlorophyll transporter n=2 Tax=Limimaricola pyoseonensis TaxID=521013 RepID=A0A1G7AZS9_9RHOB|nr:MFS transporter, BCD family, chlorophyll transporter [Limimaricola pyoseonensis]
MLGWVAIIRLGLVQMCLGAIVVLTTSTLNRLMVVELALPALLPGLLVGLHYGIQITRPHWGFFSDTQGRRSRWITGGMAVLALGGFGAALGVVIMQHSFAAGLALSVVAYAAIGLGVGASGTSLLALLASAAAPERRAAAATITWLMMVAGIAVTAGTVGALLDPYSPGLLLRIVAALGLGAVALTGLAIAGIEAKVEPRPPEPKAKLREGLAEIWAEPAARRFTVFVFLSMTAYFMQELILEPYAGLVFGFTPGQSTSLSGAQNGGVFLGMLTVGIAATGFGLGRLRSWVVGGCLGSAASLAAVSLVAQTGSGAALIAAAVALGFCNGVFAVAAIAAMMALAGQGRDRREGTRMGLWGAAQAIAAGIGGLAGAGLADLLRGLMGSDAAGFGAVFLIEAMLFVLAAALAVRAVAPGTRAPRPLAGEG